MINTALLSVSQQEGHNVRQLTHKSSDGEWRCHDSYTEWLPLVWFCWVIICSVLSLICWYDVVEWWIAGRHLHSRPYDSLPFIPKSFSFQTWEMTAVAGLLANVPFRQIVNLFKVTSFYWWVQPVTYLSSDLLMIMTACDPLSQFWLSLTACVWCTQLGNPQKCASTCIVRGHKLIMN